MQQFLIDYVTYTALCLVGVGLHGIPCFEPVFSLPFLVAQYHSKNKIRQQKYGSPLVY